MKTYLFIALITIGLFSSCSSSQKVTASWYSPDVKQGDAYKSIFIIAITSHTENRALVEAKVAELLKERGKKVILSTDKFPATAFASNTLSKEQLADIVKVSGCDAVFTIALVDEKSDTHYQQGTGVYSPKANSDYYGYYNSATTRTSAPEYYISEKTYYIESNFYDAKEDKMLFSIQSNAYNPVSFDSWFHKYSKVMFKELQRKGLVKETK